MGVWLLSRLLLGTNECRHAAVVFPLELVPAGANSCQDQNRSEPITLLC
jgi:hypothetical protein